MEDLDLLTMGALLKGYGWGRQDKEADDLKEKNREAELAYLRGTVSGLIRRVEQLEERLSK